MTDIYQMMQDSLRAGQEGYARGQQSKLARMMSGAMSGPRDARQGAVAEMAAISPEAALTADAHFNQMDDLGRKRLGEHAAMFDALPDDQKAAAYPQLAAEAQALGVPNVPSQWNPSFAQGIRMLAQAYGGVSAKGPEDFTLSPGSKRFDASGRMIAEVPFAPANGQFVTVPTGNGGTQMMFGNPRDGSLSPLGGGGGMVLDDALTNAVMQQESGGNPNAVSPAGAQGLMQLMPGTQKDPGFGVQPLQNGSPQENVRLGRDYLQAMLQRYNGDQQLALAAYNAGPGAVDQALQRAGGDPRRALLLLPQETQKYVPGVQGRIGGAQGGLGYTPPKTQAGNAPPSGYRWSADGSRLEVIQGGPADKPAPNSTTTGGANAQKTQQANATKLAQFDAAERAIDRLEKASKSLAGNSFFDGGPLDQYAVSFTKQGQELKQASAAMLPILTALTRVPGMGSQSDFEAKLAGMQMPSAEFSPEVNAAAIKALRSYMHGLKSALQGSMKQQQTAPQTAEPDPSPDIESLLDLYR